MFKNIFKIFCIVVVLGIASVIYVWADGVAEKFEQNLVRNATLKDLEGGEWNARKLGKKIGVLYFGYTFCPDVCPISLDNLVSALSGGKIEEGVFQPIFVSVDPERDSPRIIAEYLSNFSDNIIGVSGSVSDLRLFAWIMGASYSLRRTQKSDREYLVDHSANFYLVNSRGDLIVMPTRDTPEQIEKSLRKSIKKLIK
ncbi:MAG: hypothetical protein CFH08_00191 [Alphaproteobacteria bacterium MarineAlpha3_Bin7]|nr:SCO family protein [Rhodospirillaceae bacterium]PPR66097.1 MAG: hypothetical protein CFH08_00191 [Alphaproteobacteria bacterium MarineAlpha3_Bin7]